MTKNAILCSASMSEHFGFQFGFQRSWRLRMDVREWELVPGCRFLICKGTLIMRLCSNVRNTEKSIIRRRTQLTGRECKRERDQKGAREQLIQGLWNKEKKNLVISYVTAKKTMQTPKERGDVIKFGTAEDKSCSMVLDFLGFEIKWRRQRTDGLGVGGGCSDQNYFSLILVEFRFMNVHPRFWLRDAWLSGQH